MKRFFVPILAIFLPFATVCFAQTTTTAPATAISNLYAAGVAYNSSGTPAVAGDALYAHQVNSSGTYAFTLIDLLPAGVKPFTVNTNIGAGVAQKVFSVAGYDVLIPTAAGISLNGNNVGWSWTTGAGVPIKLKAYKGGNFYALPTVRVAKSSVSGGTGYQPIFGVLFGWGQ